MTTNPSRAPFFLLADFVHLACDSGDRGTTRARHRWRGPSTPCRRTSGICRGSILTAADVRRRGGACYESVSFLFVIIHDIDERAPPRERWGGIRRKDDVDARPGGDQRRHLERRAAHHCSCERRPSVGIAMLERRASPHQAERQRRKVLAHPIDVRRPMKDAHSPSVDPVSTHLFSPHEKAVRRARRRGCGSSA